MTQADIDKSVSRAISEQSLMLIKSESRVRSKASQEESGQRRQGVVQRQSVSAFTSFASASVTLDAYQGRASEEVYAESADLRELLLRNVFWR